MDSEKLREKFEAYKEGDNLERWSSGEYIDDRVEWAWVTYCDAYIAGMRRSADLICERERMELVDGHASSLLAEADALEKGR